MLLIIGMAGAAALAVVLYNHLREEQPELATQSTRKAQQLAAVVLVLSKAVEGVIDALALGGWAHSRPRCGRWPCAVTSTPSWPAGSSSRPDAGFWG